MKLSGVARLQKRLSRMEGDVKKAVKGAVKESAKDLADASAEVCPVDEETLLKSQYNEPMDDGMGAEVGYGGDAADYMNTVHEMLGEDVNWTKPGTGAKYLERPWVERRAGYSKDIKDAAKDAARKGR